MEGYINYLITDSYLSKLLSLYRVHIPHSFPSAFLQTSSNKTYFKIQLLMNYFVIFGISKPGCEKSGQIKSRNAPVLNINHLNALIKFHAVITPGSHYPPYA